ncbi:peroxisomal acyl-coenzyme A oxidase 1 [Aplysia californica]|uniref:Acyl-coenzyme A oxidase n=1 Tax=Aplysia californica TaxID=6500 RepID=A0ABM0K5U2_APLCA|nr:peroxisomal acyl-coenzyme A oxidase 1 [Aplysia californica]
MAAAFNIDISTIPVNKDLVKERATASFKVAELTHIIDGGPEKTKRRKELESIVLSDPLFLNKNGVNLTKSEAYENALQKSVKLKSWRRQYNWSEEDYEIITNRINCFDEALTLHHTMFIPALERLCNEEQKARWLPLALNYRIIGTYAQTELGHGTNLMRLETTATFDPETDEFVMNSPQISSMKWWPGGLGKSSTHAIVLAQLYVRDKHHGLQAFIVPLRSLEDHKPLPGITVGDIGPKMALANVDNGFLIMDKYRIPRDNMLMGNAVVTREGKFQMLRADKSNYSTMMYVRVQIVQWSAFTLLPGTVMAVRYSAARRQSSLKPGGEEVQILDYQTQQYKLFPALAAAHATSFAAQTLRREYDAALGDLLKGNKQVMGEFHSQTSVMKALCSDIAVEHAEILRRSCGGHGYMLLSGLAPLYTSSLGLVTVEGENTVLYQQTARYLMRQMAATLSGLTVGHSCSYLADPQETELSITSPEQLRDLDLLLTLFKRAAQRIVSQTAQRLQADMERGLPQDQAWNKNMVALVRAAKAHGWQTLVQYNVRAVQGLRGSTSPELATVLHRLCCLFALHAIETNAGNFLETEVLNPGELGLVREVEMGLLGEIRPDAVALVDAVDYPDSSLQSALGAYDGNVYERMYKTALTEPMNRTDVHPSYYKHLRGFIKGTSSKL